MFVGLTAHLLLVFLGFACALAHRIFENRLSAVLFALADDLLPQFVFMS